MGLLQEFPGNKAITDKLRWESARAAGSKTPPLKFEISLTLSRFGLGFLFSCPALKICRILRITTNHQNLMRTITVIFGTALALTGLTLAVAESKTKGSAKQSASNATSQHKILGPSDMVWGDAPPGLPPGGKMAVLDGDPTKTGSFTIRLQSPDGYKIPPHTHPTVERVTVISGALHLGMGEKFDEAAGHEMAAGSFAVMPAGMKHFAWTTGNTVIQIHSEGPFQIKYVNPADDPRNTKK